MNGKDKCKILKDIRQKIAEQNDIEWVTSECQHKGSCKGTCPKCEAEVRKLEQELSLRRKLGKTVAIAGVSAACLASLTACSVSDVIDFGESVINNVKGNTCVNVPDDELSGYIDVLEGEEEYIPDDPEVIELDGEVAADYYEIYDEGSGNDTIKP